MPGFATTAIHHGYDPQTANGALVPPVYLSATFAFSSAEQGAARFAGAEPGYFYTRIGNPTLDLLEQRIAALEGGAAAVAFGSGMGAITSTMWTLLRPGDEVLVDRTLYGCTHAFFQHGIGAFGVRVSTVDMSDAAALRQALQSRPKLVYLETPANPNLRLVDIAAVAALAHGVGALLVVDNTFCTPYLQKPLALGADIVVHSATKYLGGHGDITAGLMVAAEAELAQRVRMQGLKDLTGAVLSPQDAFLLMRGLKTLHLRMERHAANALLLARALAAHPAVARVYYPGLESDPQYALARRQMRNAGGMLAFELHGGVQAGRSFMNALRLFTRAVSLGDAESLAQHPASMTHANYTPAERAAAGISEGLVRLSAGLEDAEDLLADLQQALAAAATQHARAAEAPAAQAEDALCGAH